MALELTEKAGVDGGTWSTEVSETISLCVDLRLEVRPGDRDDGRQTTAADAVSPIASSSFSRMRLVSPYERKINIQFKKPGLKRICMYVDRQD